MLRIKKISKKIVFFIFTLIIICYYNVNFKKERFISYYCEEAEECGGWGDRLKGILSVYIWSLATDRKFFINITKSNCEFTDIFDEHLIHWNQNKILFENFRRKQKNKFTIKELNLMNALDFKKKLEEIDLENYYKDIDIIYVRTNKNFLPSYAKNPHIRNKLKNKAIDPDNLDLE